LGPIKADPVPLTEVTVCVTGAGGPAGFNCIRSLAESDLEPRIVAVDMDRKAPGLYHGSHAGYVVPPARSEDFVLALSRVLEREKADVLLPTVDEEIRALCREPVLENLSRVTGFILPPEEVAARALDKFVTVFTAKREGLPVPETVVVETLGGARERAEAVGYPLVAKPSRSRGARGVRYVHGPGDVEEAWRAASEEGGQVLFQEYVSGPVFTIGIVADREGGIAASIVLRKTKEIPPSGGVAVAGVTVSNPELQDLGERYVRALEWVGPASVEVKMDERDGSYKLMEVNPRLFGYNYLAAKAGVNLAEVTVRLALGEKVEPRRRYEAGLSFVRSPYDLVIREEI
jgi:carbamoyl-phosphate synthase large subunit